MLSFAHEYVKTSGRMKDSLFATDSIPLVLASGSSISADWSPVRRLARNASRLLMIFKIWKKGGIHSVFGGHWTLMWIA
jgi:hypothetical protein